MLFTLTSGATGIYFKPAPPIVIPILSELNHIFITGQSNSIGANAKPILSGSQPYNNKMFNTGIVAGKNNLTSIVPLIEIDTPDSGETLASGMLNFLSFQGNGTHFVSSNGVGGFRYDQLAKDTEPYKTGIAQIQAAKVLANSESIPYKVSVIVNVHGESDQIFDKPNYSTNVIQWQADYEADIKAISGQTGNIPMLLCQQQVYSPADAINQGTSTALELFKAHKLNPNKIVLVGPRYQYDYIDGIHLTNHSQRWHGEQYGKVYKHLIDGQQWRPLSPNTATISNNEINIQFYVPVPPLAIDTHMIVAPSNTAFGFEFWDNSGNPPAITEVSISSPTSIKIILASVPQGTSKQIRYAYTKTLPQSGRMTGARGNLRDSDSTSSENNYPLYNWCIHFAVDL